MSIGSSVDTSVQEAISKILKDDRQDKDTDEDFEPSEIREHKLPGKGRSRQTENRKSKRKSAYLKLSKRISRIRELIECNVDRELLEVERDDLDVEKEDFNQACRTYEEIFKSSRDRDDA